MVHVPDFARRVSDFARFTLSCADFKRFSCSGKQFLRVEYFIKLVVIYPWKSKLTTHYSTSIHRKWNIGIGSVRSFVRIAQYLQNRKEHQFGIWHIENMFSRDSARLFEILKKFEKLSIKLGNMFSRCQVS